MFISKEKYKACIYTRLSKDDGDKAESHSISSQKSMCGDYIRWQGDMELVDTFVDDGYSGVSLDRPGFRRLEEAIRKGQVDAVVCKDLSRFSRKYIEGGRYLEKIFPQLGVRFVAINDAYDSLGGSPQADSFLVPFKNLINDAYCKDISVKIRTNLDAKRRRGEYVGAYAPYGYVKDSADRNSLAVDEAAAKTVRQIFSMYKEGKGIGSIADQLNGLGVPSPMEHKNSMGIRYRTSFRTGKEAKWSYQAVRRILTNEVYIGVLAQGKRGTPNYKVREVQEKDRSEWVTVEGRHEPLVPYEDFAAVQEMLRRDTRSTGDGSEENLLSGFVFCAECGQPMARKVVPSKKGRNYYYYVCSTNRRHEGCSPHSISTKEVERAVANAIRGQVSSIIDMEAALEYIASLPDTGRGLEDYGALAERLQDEIGKYRKRKLRLYEDLSDGIIDKAEYADFRREYSAIIEEKEAALERVRQEERKAKEGQGKGRQWIEAFKKHRNIEALDRRTLMELVDRILIHEGHSVEILFRYRDEYQRAGETIENSGALPAGAI